MSEYGKTSYSSTIKYLSRINSALKNEEKKSLTEILKDFQYMTEDFQEMNKKIENEKVIYSNARFDLCPIEEQRKFINDQLQLIETLVTQKITYTSGNIYNWYDIFGLMHDKNYATFEKKDRMVVFSTADTKRPIGDVAYNMWNGLQIFDLDIKNADLADKLKPILFDELKKYEWFLGVCKSTSMKSLHIWTKIIPISNELNARRVEFRCNFRQKYSYIYLTLLKWSHKLGYTKKDIISYMDNAMAKPQQGIFISSDNAYMNTGFMDLRLNVTFEAAINTGIESINWITHPDLKEIFAKLEWFDNDVFNKRTNVDMNNIENIDERNLKKDVGPIHYKYPQRWQLANTLTSLYGEQKALDIMVNICQGTDRKELRGIVHTASIHNKPLTKWAINELNNKHGFAIKIKEDMNEVEKNMQEVDKLLTTTTAENDPIHVLNDKTEKLTFYITKDQYLSDIKDQIFGNLSKITLLEAGAGYGKTEMIKSFKGKVLLVLPFTSIIKSKIELDEKMTDWLYFYANKRPTLDDLVSDKSITMTIDKFSHLNLMEIDQANFEYIVIDESHLLFTSSYRNVMSPTIQRLANCKAKVIMMTGTPTGETLFFPNIKHICIKKEETRIKSFTTYMCPSEYEQEHEMIVAMADDVLAGIKILWPSNKGNTYFEQIMALVQHEIDLRHDQNFTRQIRTFYYKKSNYGDEDMDNINRNKSIGDNDIIGCTTYLSVGVDICDQERFHVYFNEPMMAQDIEQYANRLRKLDLYVKMFLPMSINGMNIDWETTKPLKLKLEQDGIIFARDIVKTANEMLERNVDEAKYNPFILSMLTANQFLKYDEVDSRYYIDETAYKLRFFEEKYKDEYSKQLNVIKQSMLYYGYAIDSKTFDRVISEETKVGIDEKKKEIKHRRWDEMTEGVKKFLSKITDDNIEYYREAANGSYQIFKDFGYNDKGERYEDIREENELYVDSLEVLEKNAKYVLSFYRFYTIDTIKDIYNFCIDKNNRLNYSKLDKIDRFVKIEYNRQRNKLDFPILKFLKDAQSFAKKNPVVTQEQINKWQAIYAARYANSIGGLVVDDIKYFEQMFQLTKRLWGVVIIQSRPRGGKITIAPFELSWTRKDILRDVYGLESTHEFLIQSLDDEIEKKVKEDDEAEVPIPEFDIKANITLGDVLPEIPNIIHEGYSYDEYTVLDGSNDKFLQKQKNTQNIEQMIKMQAEKEGLDIAQDDLCKIEEEDKLKKEATLFDDIGDLPF